MDPQPVALIQGVDRLDQQHGERGAQDHLQRFVVDGQLFWGPWMCDCNLQLVGVISLTSAGDFDFRAKATDEQRLQIAQSKIKPEPFAASPGDWVTYRASNTRNSTSSATVADKTVRALPGCKLVNLYGATEARRLVRGQPRPATAARSSKRNQKRAEARGARPLGSG